MRTRQIICSYFSYFVYSVIKQAATTPHNYIGHRCSCDVIWYPVVDGASGGVSGPRGCWTPCRDGCCGRVVQASFVCSLQLIISLNQYSAMLPSDVFMYMYMVSELLLLAFETVYTLNPC